MATPPSFVSVTATAVNTATSPKTTASIAVQAGDVLIAWCVAENGTAGGGAFNINVTTATGSTTAWTQRVADTPDPVDPGAVCYRRGLSASATATGNITVTFTRSAGSTAPAMGGYVEVWRGSGGIGDATAGTNGRGANSAPTVAVTASANSGLSFFDADWNASAGTVTFSATSGSLVTDVSDQSGAGSTYCIFSSHVVDVGTAGSKSMGMSAPSAQRWVAGSIEILSAGPPTVIAGISTAVTPVGPFKSSGGNFYFFGRDGTTATTLQAYKSTAPDTLWSSIATKTGFTTAILNIAAYQVGNVIHMVVQDGTLSSSVATKYLSFDASTDTFLATTETVAAAAIITGQATAGWGASIVVRTTSGLPVILYNGLQVNTSSTPYARLYYRERTGLNTYGTATRVDANTAVDMLDPEAVLGASDSVHFLFRDFNGTAIRQRTLSSGNVLQTAGVTGAVYGTANGGPSSAVSYSRSGTTKIIYARTSNTANTFIDVYFDSGNTPTLNNQSDTSSGLGATPRLFVDGTDVWALYSGSATNFLYARVSTDDGASFGTQATAFSGNVAGLYTSLSHDANIYQRGSNVVIPYIANDGGTLKYNEYTVRTVTVGYTLAADAGVVALSGQTARTFATRKLPVPAEADLILAGQAAALRTARKTAAGLGTLTSAGQAATLARSRTMPVTVGTLTAAGQDVTLTKAAGAVHRTMPADVGTLTLAGQVTVLRTVRKLVAGQGTLTLAGQVVTTRFAHRMAAGLGTLTLAGQTAIIRYAHKAPAGQGTLTPSGQNVTLRYSRKMPADLGTVTLAGQAVNTIYSGAGAKLLPAGLGTVTLAGQTVTLRYAHKLAAGTGTLTLAGQDVTLTKFTPITHYSMPAALGTLTLAGQAATLTKSSAITHYRLAVEHGTLTIDGQPVVIRYAHRMAAGVGVLTVSGQTVTLSTTAPATLSTLTLSGRDVTLRKINKIRMLADAGTLTLSGQVLTLRRSRVPMVAALGTLTLSGRPIALPKGRMLAAGVGSIVLSGKAAGLAYKEQIRMAAEPGILHLVEQDVILSKTTVPPVIRHETLRFGRSVYVSRW